MKKFILGLSVLFTFSSTTFAGTSTYQDGVVFCMVITDNGGISDNPAALSCQASVKIDTRQLANAEIAIVEYVVVGKTVRLKRIVNGSHVCYLLTGYKANVLSCVQ